MSPLFITSLPELTVIVLQLLLVALPIILIFALYKLMQRVWTEYTD